MTDTENTIEYYAKLLIIQYLGRLRAFATIKAVVTPVVMGTSDIQTLIFSSVPASGNFKLEYDGVDTASIAWNADATTIEAALQTILPAPLTVEVDGSIADKLTFIFTDFTSEVLLLSVVDNTLSGSPTPSFSPVGEQLPIVVQNGFNLLGSNTAVGAQLDILGKYQGVTRNVYGFNGPVSLDDADFLKFIQMAIVRNSAGSSLGTIQNFIFRFFGNQIILHDYANMHMSYLISSGIGSTGLLQAFVEEGLLPKPMGVGLSVIVFPVITEFFAFRTYDGPASADTNPFNDYDTYHTDWPWVSYADAI